MSEICHVLKLNRLQAPAGPVNRNPTTPPDGAERAIDAASPVTIRPRMRLRARAAKVICGNYW